MVNSTYGHCLICIILMWPKRSVFSFLPWCPSQIPINKVANKQTKLAFAGFPALEVMPAMQLVSFLHGQL
jgi:hypothetical protein